MEYARKVCLVPYLKMKYYQWWWSVVRKTSDKSLKNFSLMIWRDNYIMTVHLMVTEFCSLIWKFLISLRSSSARILLILHFLQYKDNLDWKYKIIIGLKSNNYASTICGIWLTKSWVLIFLFSIIYLFILKLFTEFIYLKIILRFCIIWYHYNLDNNI